MAELPQQAYPVVGSGPDAEELARIADAYAEALHACNENEYLSLKLRVVQDPHNPFHWFLHFRGLEAALFSSFTGGIYGHVQFCSVGRSDKKKNRRFLKDAPAFGIITPTGEATASLFTSYKPDGSYSTGAKDIGIPGVCGTAYADAHIYRMAMMDTYKGQPLQTGATYKWTARSGKEGSVTVHEEYLEVTNSGGEYGQYKCPILRYQGSIVRWLKQVVTMLDSGIGPRGPLLGCGFDGLGRYPPFLAPFDKIAAAAAASATWAQVAYNGHLLELFAAPPAPPPQPQLPAPPPPPQDNNGTRNARDVEVLVIAGGSTQVAQAELLRDEAARTMVGDATIEVTGYTAQVLKREPGVELNGEVRRGRACGTPLAVTNPVFIATGSLQAPRRRARSGAETFGEEHSQAEQPEVRRPRRDAPMRLFSRGQRVSCTFEHDGRDTVFEGSVVDVFGEFRSCDVSFDDGSSHRIDWSRLTRL